LSFLCPRKERTKESALKLFLLLRRKSFRIKKKKPTSRLRLAGFGKEVLTSSAKGRLRKCRMAFSRLVGLGEKVLTSSTEVSASLHRTVLGRFAGFGKTVRPLTPRLWQTFTA